MTATPQVTELPVASLVIHPLNARTPKDEPDAGLVASIAAIGLLQPITVAPLGGKSKGLGVILGAGRLAAFRALGHDTIPGFVIDASDAADLLARSAAENIVRRSLPAVDQWKAVRAMQAKGMAIPDAAAALGLTEQFVRRLDKLGQLAPEVLAVIEAHGLPDYRYLATIANAPQDKQREGLVAALIKGRKGEGDEVNWHTLANVCTIKRISRKRAIFDTEAEGAPVFEQDLFAEAGSDEEFTTSDLAGFHRAQRAAVDAWIAKHAKKHGDRVQFGTLNEYGWNFETPRGWMLDEVPSGLPEPLRLGKGKHLLVGIRDDGAIRTTIFRVVDLPEQVRGAGSAAADKPARGPITKAGQQFIAEAKGQAVRAALTNGRSVTTPLNMLRVLLAALSAQNVSVPGARGSVAGDGLRAMTPIAPEAPDPTEPEVMAKAAEIVGSILQFDHPLSDWHGTAGAVADQIAEYIGAAPHLPRFDVDEFLSQCSADVLREAARAAGLGDLPKKTGDLRKHLVGKLADWRPADFATAAAAEARVPPEDDGEGEGEGEPE